MARWHPDSRATRLVHLYIRTLHPGCFRTEQEQLFDVAEDPFLTRNVIAESPEVADHTKALLGDWWHEHAGVPNAAPDPMQTTLEVGPTFQFKPVDYVEHLRKTGRKHFAEELEERLRVSLGIFRG